MKNKKLFIVMVGNIGSGKSTLAKCLVKEKFIACSRDSLRYMIGGGDYVFDPKLEPVIAEARDSMLTIFLENQLDIIIDEVNVQRDRRMDLNMIADDFGYTKVAIILPKLSRVISVRRRLQNEHGKFGKEVWNGVWDRFDKLYTKPSKKEYFDCIIEMKKSTTIKQVCEKLEKIKSE